MATGLYSEGSVVDPSKDINITQYGWGVEDVKGITLIQDYIDKAQAIYQDVLNAKSILQVLIQEASEVESFYQEIKKVQEDIHQKYPIIVDQYNQIVSLARDVNASRDAASVSAKAASDKVVQAQGILTQMQGLNSSVQSALTNVNTRYNEIVALRDEVKAMNTESKQLVDDLRKGQVYRGTWNPHSGAWPDPKGTYSAWDVVLNPKEASFDWNGIKWLPGDRLLYILSEARYEQVESGVGVLSVNSKSGYVTLVPNDLGAYTKAEVDAKITPKFNTAGGTLTGTVTGPSFVQSGAQGTTGTSLTRKDYVDGLLATKVDKTITVNGKPLSGSVSLTSDDVGARSLTWVPGWTDITGVPTTFPPSTHQHSWGDLTGVPVQATRWPTAAEVGAMPSTGVALNNSALGVQRNLSGNTKSIALEVDDSGIGYISSDFARRMLDFTTQGVDVRYGMLQEAGQRVYSPNNKPTAADVKARPDTWNPSSLTLVNKANANVMTGVGYNAFSNTAAAINFPSGVIGSGYEIVNGQADGKTLDSSVFQLWSPNDSPDVFTRTGDGSATGWVFRSWDKMYTSNNKPSSTDIGAVAKAGDTMTGKLIVPSFTDKLTGIGEVVLPYKTLALADWGGVVGQTTFAKPDSIGAPSGTSGGYWNVLGKRDGAGGYAGLYIPYAHADNRIFIGRNEFGTNAPTWIKIYTDINKPTPAEIGAMDSTVDLNALGGLPKEGGVLSTTTDINTLVGPARHNIPGANPNWAFPGNGGILDVYVHGGTYVRQVAFNGGNSQIKTRSLSGSSWSTWATVYTSADKPTPADLGALSTSGGTATGNITAPDFLQSTAQTNNAAASTRKDYVDTQDNLRVLKTTTVNGKPLSGNITLTPADIGAQPAGGASNSANFLTRIDTRADNKIPSSINPGFSQEFKLNTTDGFTQGGGIYHTILSMQQWGDSSGGFAKQLAIGDNGKIGLRVGSADYNSWGPWSMLYSEDNKPTAADVGAVPKHNWDAKVKLGSWSAIGQFNSSNNLAGKALVTVGHTRGSFVANARFLISWGHAQQASVTQLESHGYSQIQVRVGVTSGDNCIFSIMDTDYGTTSVGTEVVYKCQVDELDGTIQPFLMFTSDVGITTVKETLTTEWKAIKIGNNKVYHQSFKPTAADVGAVNKAGDTMTGELKTPMLSTLLADNLDTIGDTSGFTFKYALPSAIGKPTGQDHAVLTQSYSDAWQTQLASDWRTNRWYVRSQENGTWKTWEEVYTTLNKPTPAEIGAAPAGFGLGEYGRTISTVTGNTDLRRQSGFFQGTNIAGLPTSPHTWNYVFSQAHGNTAGYFGYLAISFNGNKAWVGGQEGGAQKGPYEVVLNNAGQRFVGAGTGNDFQQGTIEANGNGAADTVKPVIGFHQPGLFASSLALWAGGDFRFHNQALNGYSSIMTGNVNAQDVYIRSDLRLKTNLKQLEGALDKVNQLTAYSYDKKQTLKSEEYDKHEVGLIAQDVEKVLPEAISRVEDSNEEGSGNEILTISNSAVNALLVEAIKELTAKVNSLRRS